MLAALVTILAAAPPPVDGATVFASKCQFCHKPESGTRAPILSALQSLTPAAVRSSLTTGSMKEQGAELSVEEREAVIAYLGKGVELGASPVVCASPIPKLGKLAGWQGWSASSGNTRRVERTLDPTNLKLKWAFGYPQSGMAISQPAVVDGVLFTGSGVGGERAGVVYALDAATGCEYWRFAAEAAVRTAFSIHNGVVVFGDTRANVYGVRAATGERAWKTKVDDHAFARITGSPSLHAGRVYVPVSSAEEVPAANPKYPCCSFRGSVVALDAATGRQVWKSYTIPTSAGSGGAVWLSPTIDAKRGVLYVGTGNEYRDPPSEFTDAIIAFDLTTGERKWHRQMTPNDRWNMACVSPNKESCPKNAGEDFDFGAAPLLIGSRIYAAQKSGIVHALDADRKGAIVWQTRVGKGGALGGVEFGIGADSERLYVPLSDWSPDPKAGGGLFALQLATGEKLWHTPAPTPACLGKPGCNAAQMAPPTVLANIVFSGSMDGRLRAYETKTGKIVWEFDTLRDFETVNKVPAKGGALNAVGPVVVGDWVYVQSGYGSLGGMPGNVLLAFSID
jgi:polyvinyl alcohol dehydrogenase (cytochrome)